MAVKLTKEESVDKINLRKDTFVSLTKKDPTLDNLKSKVGFVLDYSYSMEKHYKDGSMQQLLEMLIPIALKFDDNGALDFWIFHDGFHRIGEVTMNNFYGFIENEVLAKYTMGLTQYSPVMADVYKMYIDEEPSDLPSYMMFVTDGDCQDKPKTFALLKDKADKPVFWQFIGMGKGPFKTLEALDDLEDRYIDNADFFQVDDLVSMTESDLYSKLMTEYPGYLQEAVHKNMITLSKKEEVKEKKIMAVSLTKGGKVSLAKAAEQVGVAFPKRIGVGLGWDTNRYDGGDQFDLDASAFANTGAGKVVDDAHFVFYNNTDVPGIHHTGDNRTGEGEGDDELIEITLDSVEPSVEKIDFSVTIDRAEDRKQNFGMIENAYIRVFDLDSNTELIRYDLGEDFSVETALVVGELYRHNGEWKFNAIGSGFSGGLFALCKNFGVNV